MIKIKLDPLLNSVPVGSLLEEYWITKNGAVLPKELNEFADYEIKKNPNADVLELPEDRYLEIITPLKEIQLPKPR